jgi:heme-degrading monooxygenase HmoA
MILEVATLQIKPGQTAAFEAAFAQAQKIIASMYGYLGHELQHCVEDDRQYVLLVRWATLEDHTVGFRQSAQYQEWRTLLHHFYDPFPTVLHYEPVMLKRTPQQLADAYSKRQALIEELKKHHANMPMTTPVVEQMRRDARY